VVETNRSAGGEHARFEEVFARVDEAVGPPAEHAGAAIAAGVIGLVVVLLAPMFALLIPGRDVLFARMIVLFVGGLTAVLVGAAGTTRCNEEPGAGLCLGAAILGGVEIAFGFGLLLAID
jgi:hypothetical protein